MKNARLDSMLSAAILACDPQADSWDVVHVARTLLRGETGVTAIDGEGRMVIDCLPISLTIEADVYEVEPVTLRSPRFAA